MVSVDKFASVFEIGFAMNALFYIFDAIPRTEDAINRLFKKHEETRREKIEVTRNHEAFPIALVVGSTYPLYKFVLTRLSIAMSVACLGMLIWSAFCPSVELSTRMMIVILTLLLGLVPASALILYVSTTSLVQSSINLLQKQIDKQHEVDCHQTTASLPARSETTDTAGTVDSEKVDRSNKGI